MNPSASLTDTATVALLTLLHSWQISRASSRVLAVLDQSVFTIHQTDATYTVFSYGQRNIRIHCLLYSTEDARLRFLR